MILFQFPRLFLNKSGITRHFWSKKKTNFGKFKLVEPGNVSEQKQVPDNIAKPSYYKSGVPTESLDHPEVKTEQQILGMRNSCKLAANVLKSIGDHIKVGQTTDEVDTFVHDLIVNNGAYPSPLNYRNFPKSVCTSVNNVACHGIPDDRALEDGDIVNIDITVYFQGFHGDCSKTFLIGRVDEVGRDLTKAAEVCLNEAIDICKPGQKFSEIGKFIEQNAKKLGYTVIPAFAGHGIGHYFHGPPDIYHVRNNYPGVMEPGMTFTIEPAITQGIQEIIILEDNWTAMTLDFSRSAQFEHTVLITDSGVEILTVPD